MNFANSTFVLPEKTEWAGTKLSDAGKLHAEDDHLDVEKTFDVVPETYVMKARCP